MRGPAAALGIAMLGRAVEILGADLLLAPGREAVTSGGTGAALVTHVVTADATADATAGVTPTVGAVHGLGLATPADGKS